MVVYWDFDGVLVDSWKVIDEIKKKVSIEDYGAFYSNMDWEFILNEAKVIDINCILLDRIRCLYQTKILTAFSSLDETIQKNKWIKKRWKDVEIIFVPHGVDKGSFVDCKDNILIDDNEKNIRIWNESGGVGILFNDINTIETRIEGILGKL